MDTKLQTLAITLACIVILLPAAEVRAAKDCKVDKKGIISCLPAIEDTNYPVPNPTGECCKALANANLPCLCSSYKNSPDLKKYGINPKLAMKLPGKCKLPVPKECH